MANTTDVQEALQLTSRVRQEARAQAALQQRLTNAVRGKENTVTAMSRAAPLPSPRPGRSSQAAIFGDDERMEKRKALA